MTVSRAATKSALAAALCAVGALLLPLRFADDGAEPSRWSSFLGGFHPLILHVPIGIVVALAAFELWSLACRSGDARLRRFLWFVAALSASISFGTGLLLGAGGGRDRALLIPHLWCGSVFTALCWFALGLMCLRDSRRWSAVAVIVVAIPMIGAGHFGGLMVHGSPFADAPWKPDPTAREILPPLGETIAVHADLVQPILTAKCQRCHGPGKQNAKLRFDSFERLLAGGTHGPAFIAGRATDSRMLKLIALPLENDKHMPPKNRPQLTEAEVELLHWWINAGASDEVVVAKADAPPVLTPFLVPDYRLLPDRVLQAKQEAEQKQRRETETRRRAEVEQLLGTLRGDLRGALVFASETSADLNLTLATSPAEFRDDELHAVAPLLHACRQVDLADTAITDAGLAAVAFSSTLRDLSLKDTLVSVAGLRSLATAPQLESLNLFGTAIDSRIADVLAQLPALRRVFLGQTRVSEDELRALQRQFPACDIIGDLAVPAAGTTSRIGDQRDSAPGSARSARAVSGSALETFGKRLARRVGSSEQCKCRVSNLS